MATPQVDTPDYFNAVIYRRTLSVDGEDVQRIGPDDPDFGVISFCIFRALKMLNTPAALEAMNIISYGVLKDNPNEKLPIELVAGTWVKKVFLASIEDEFPAICIDELVTDDHGAGIIHSTPWRPTGWHHSLVIQLNAYFVSLVRDYTRKGELKNQRATLFRLINSIFLMVCVHILNADLAIGRLMQPPTGFSPPKLEETLEQADLIQRDHVSRWLENYVLGGVLRNKSFVIREKAILRKQDEHDKNQIWDFEVGEKALNGILALEGEGKSQPQSLAWVRSIPTAAINQTPVIRLPYDVGRQLDHTVVPQPTSPIDENKADASRKLPPLPQTVPLENTKTVPHKVLCTLGSNMHGVVNDPNIHVQVIKQEVKKKPSLMDMLKIGSSEGEERAGAGEPSSSGGNTSDKSLRKKLKKKLSGEGCRQQ